MASKAVAFPGLPVIYAEGYRENRVSFHGHISLALTDVRESIRTETSVEDSEENVFLVEGKRLEGERGRDMLKIRDLMIGKSGIDKRLKIASKNYGILTGSSDSGAAALAVALNEFLGLKLHAGELHAIARQGSETAYRSLVGGLSEYYLIGGVPHARSLLHAEELKDLSIFAVPFDYPRISADVLHANVVKHPQYKRRMTDVENRIHGFKSHLIERDFSGCLQLMEDDARQVHGMFQDLGLTVRKEGMKGLCDKVEAWRKTGVECYWNVAGGSVVYVMALRGFRRELQKRLQAYKTIECKTAGPAKVF
jgi:mevalonate pyrophosphate decarboxylase